jgi:hypothetical protein
MYRALIRLRTKQFGCTGLYSSTYFAQLPSLILIYNLYYVSTYYSTIDFFSSPLTLALECARAERVHPLTYLLFFSVSDKVPQSIYPIDPLSSSDLRSRAGRVITHSLHSLNVGSALSLGYLLSRVEGFLLSSYARRPAHHPQFRSSR